MVWIALVVVIHALVQLYRLYKRVLVLECIANALVPIFAIWVLTGGKYYSFAVCTGLAIVSAVVVATGGSVRVLNIMVPILGVLVMQHRASVRFVAILVFQVGRIWFEYRGNPLNSKSIFGRWSVSKVCVLAMIVVEIGVFLKWKRVDREFVNNVFSAYVLHLVLIQELWGYYTRSGVEVDLDCFILFYSLRHENITDRVIFNSVLKCCENLYLLLWHYQSVHIPALLNEVLASDPTPLQSVFENRNFQGMMMQSLEFMQKFRGSHNQISPYVMKNFRNTFAGFMNYEPRQFSLFSTNILSLSKCVPYKTRSSPKTNSDLSKYDENPRIISFPNEDRSGIWYAAFSGDNEKIIGTNEDLEFVLHVYRWFIRENSVSSKDIDEYSICISDFVYSLVYLLERSLK
jgi:hypothetical protein